MDAVVLVPRRSDPWRDKLWGYVRQRLSAEVDWPILEGLSESGPFNRAAAVNAAAAAAGDWSVAVILDADSVIAGEQLRAGAEHAAESGRLVLPHMAFRSLSRRATREVLRNGADPATAQARWITPETKSSCLCVGRRLWDVVGGFDEAFVGWGFEDAAFFAACRWMAGVERLAGEVVHLWHPRSPEKNRTSPHYIANRERARRYKAARSASAMCELLRELRG